MFQHQFVWARNERPVPPDKRWGVCPTSQAANESAWARLVMSEGY